MQQILKIKSPECLDRINIMLAKHPQIKVVNICGISNTSCAYVILEVNDGTNLDDIIHERITDRLGKLY